MAVGEWVGVKDVNLKCPICGKPDWCMLHRDGKKIICPRVKSNVHLGKSGWLHKVYENGMTAKNKKISKRRSNTCINWTSLATNYYRKGYRNLAKLGTLSEELGAGVENLRARWRVGWDGEAYTIPAYNGMGEMNGIMRRFPDGRKVWVSRSRNGLFIPKMTKYGNIFVTEGWSDAVVLLEMGFRAIGRSNCQTGLSYIKTLLQHNTAILQVTVVADNDKVGTKGAYDLAKALYGTVHTAVTEIPEEYKDMREWFQRGATKQDVIDRSRCL
jgi:hypothetical protein